MFIEPNSHIKIYRGVESSGKRRPIFKTRADQTAYFNSKLVFDYAPTTVVKYTMNRVRVSYSVAQLLGCNYISFVNPSFGNKIYYANIVGDPIYINNECTEIEYSIDYCQTDMFDVTLEPCYNDREQLTDEDYTKSVTNPFDKTIQEFWTSEPLPVSKDVEDTYTITNSQSDGCFYAANSISYDFPYRMVDVLAVPHLTPPNATEEAWYTAFLNTITTDTSLYAMYYDSSEHNGFHFSPKMISDLFDGSTPSYGSRMKMSYDLFVIDNLGISNENLIWGDDGLMAHLTLWGADKNIIALHEVPLFMIQGLFAEYGSQGYTREYVNVTLPNVSSYHNKKLARYPFSYIRVTTPSGDIKEFPFEFFDLTNAALETANTAQFDICFDYNTQPEFSLVPMFYKMWSSVSGAQSGGKYNFTERIAFQAIPQMPFSTDGFLAGLAASNADILSSRTIANDFAVTHALQQTEYASFDYETAKLRAGQQEIKEDFGVMMKAPLAATGVGLFALGQEQMKNTVAQQERANNLARQEDNLQYARRSNSLQKDMMTDSANMSLANIESNTVYKNIKDTKPLYVCDKYTPGSGTGLSYYNDHSPIDMVVTRVKLRDAVLQKYDQFFSNYGYASGRFGVPRIMAYLSNAATGKPHFAPSGSHNVTYIKTTDAAVIAPSKTSETFWEGMLNAGCQFIDGTSLLPTTPTPTT